MAVDASGTFSDTKRQVGLLRMLQAGVIVSDYATLMVEIPKDNARPSAAALELRQTIRATQVCVRVLAVCAEAGNTNDAGKNK